MTDFCKPDARAFDTLALSRENGYRVDAAGL